MLWIGLIGENVFAIKHTLDNRMDDDDDGMSERWKQKEGGVFY